MNVLLTVLFIGSAFCPTDADVFAASGGLATTFQLEKQIVNVLSDFVTKTEAKLETIRRFSVALIIKKKRIVH